MLAVFNFTIGCITSDSCNNRIRLSFAYFSTQIDTVDITNSGVMIVRIIAVDPREYLIINGQVVLEYRFMALPECREGFVLVATLRVDSLC